MLYHFGATVLPGGFTGVDVFFVISGYLIGGLLWAELQSTGTVRLGAFWMRRIRRLAPAFLAMVAVVSVACWLLLLPFDLREYGKELIAATLWLSNVQFWRSAGYFDTGAEEKVLLHTWSLSVEEQFYIALPLLVLLLRRRGLLPVLLALWAASLVACVALTPSRPEATFYLFPFRAWELLTGVIFAILRAQGRLLPMGGPGITALGLALIVYGMVTIPAGPGFPGAQALIPVAGAALVLLNAGDGNIVNRALASPAPVFFGLISYSLYLWHWPVAVLSAYVLGEADRWQDTAVWIGLSVVLAFLSWKLIEQPFRRPGAIGGRRLLAGFGAGVTLSLGFGAAVFLANGVPGRFGPEAQAHIAASNGFLQDWSRCTRPTDGPFAGVETCAIGPEGAPQVLIWGDSHLRALMDGLAVAADDAQVPGVIIWNAGCPPFFGVTKVELAATRAEDAACNAASRVMEDALTQVPGIERVLLVGRWTYYSTGTGIGRDEPNRITIGPDPDPRAQFAAMLADTVTRLQSLGKEVTIFRQVPEIPLYDSRRIARGLAHGTIPPAEAARRMTAPPEELAQRVESAEAAIRATGAPVIDPWPILCPDLCTATLGDSVVYFDNNHLTNEGAIAISPLFRPFLTGSADG